MASHTENLTAAIHIIVAQKDILAANARVADLVKGTAIERAVLNELLTIVDEVAKVGEQLKIIRNRT